jgi:hypothetical protein
LVFLNRSPNRPGWVTGRLVGCPAVVAGSSAGRRFRHYLVVGAAAFAFERDVHQALGSMTVESHASQVELMKATTFKASTSDL